MAVNDITSSNSIPLVQQVLSGNTGTAASARLSGANLAAIRAAELQQPGSALQNELINQALQNLRFVPQPRADTLLTNDTSAQLAVNETLRNIFATQQNALQANQARLNANAAARAAPPATQVVSTAGAAAAPQQAAAATQPVVQPPATTVAPATTTIAAAPVVAPAPGEATAVPTPQAAIPAAQQVPGNTAGVASAPQPAGNQPTTTAAAVTQNPNTILQNELLINQALQNLSFVPQPQANTQVNAAPAQPAATQQNPTAAQAATTAAPATTQAPAQQTTAPEQVPNPILQNQLLINQALQNLNFVGTRANNPLATITPPALATPAATQGNAILQNELLINQALQNLNFVSQPQTNALLINETPVQLAANETLQNLTGVQQNQLQTNQTLLNLNATAQTATPAAVTQATAATTAAAILQAAQTRQATAAAALAATQVPATTVTAATATAAAPPVDPLPPGAVTTVFTATPITATFANQQSTPVPFFLVNPDRTPYVIAVYEVRNPSPAPEEPAPIPNEVRPPLPASRARTVGRATLRQAWANYRARAYEENIPPAAPVAERDLRHVLTQVNADMAANGLPLHLVFARNETGYALNVYDCSDNELCRLTRDVPLKFEDTTITNLLQETGIMINTSS